MPIKTQVQNANVQVDPLSFVADITILSGNNVQVYNRDIQEYVPDRSLVPMVILPYVAVSDPEEVMDGEQALTGVEWYEGNPKADGSNRITGNENYEISDGSVEGFPLYALKVKKNVPADNPMELFAIFFFTDKRKNTEVRVERSLPVYTSTYDSQNYSVKLTDTPKAWTINPMIEKPDSEGRWMRTVTAQLYSGKNPVPDENAAYWWQVNDGSGWREFNDEELAVLVAGPEEGGHWSKALSFDARMIKGNISFRARAAYYLDEYPSAPISEELQVVTSINVEMPTTLRVETRQTKGARVKSDMSTPVAYEAMISYNNTEVGEDKDDFFYIEWFGKSTKAGSKEQKLGVGRRIEFIPKNFGAEKGYGYTVYASVQLYSHYYAVKNEDGTLATTDDGKVIINIQYQ